MSSERLVLYIRPFELNIQNRGARCGAVRVRCGGAWWGQGSCDRDLSGEVGDRDRGARCVVGTEQLGTTSRRRTDAASTAPDAFVRIRPLQKGV